MAAEKKIGVVIPVYNAKRYLRQCIQSVLNQTFQDFCLILVDDGSSDGSGKICDTYAAKDSRVCVIHQPNQGAFAARNAGLDAAGGALIGFVDADDWLEPNMYETLYALLRDTAADIAQCEMVNDGAYQQMRSVTLGGPVTYRREQLTEAMFRNEISHNLMNKLYRAEIWKGFHFQEGLYHLDAAFMCRLPERCARLSRTDAALYHYNTDGGSITRGRRNMAHVRSMQNLFAAYSQAAESAHPDGDFFVCREIPSTGRLLPASRAIPLPVCIRHIRRMHRIFKRHWPAARTAEGYRTSPRAKKLLWHIYACAPVTATALVYLRARRQEHGPQLR